jgi:Ca2+-binding EF-hand superfamily protein
MYVCIQAGDSLQCDSVLAVMFDLYDENKDGYITREELLRIIRPTYTAVDALGRAKIDERYDTPEKASRYQ